MTNLYGVDARTGERLEPGVPETTPEEVAELCAAADRAAPPLAALPPAERARLQVIGDAVPAETQLTGGPG
ncbi:hypothetical protein ACWCQV_44115, partial [Streptomyces eurythermus]